MRWLAGGDVEGGGNEEEEREDDEDEENSAALSMFGVDDVAAAADGEDGVVVFWFALQTPLAVATPLVFLCQRLLSDERNDVDVGVVARAALGSADACRGGIVFDDIVVDAIESICFFL